MSAILSTSAALVATRTISSTFTTPAVSVPRLSGALLALEISVVVPDSGNISFVSEYSVDGGGTFRLLTVDAFTGRVPSTRIGASSNARAFTRVDLPTSTSLLLRARVPDVTGSWPTTIKAEVQ